MVDVAISTPAFDEEASKVDAKAAASLLTPEGRAEIKRLVNEAWEKAQNKGAEIYTVVSDFFSKLGDWFKENISKPIGVFFEKAKKNFEESAKKSEELEKQRDRHATGATLGEISGRGKEAMAPAGWAEYKSDEGRKDPNRVEHKNRVAVNKELMESMKDIREGLDKAGTVRASRPLMQDIRDAGGKPNKKTPSRE